MFFRSEPIASGKHGIGGVLAEATERTGGLPYMSVNVWSELRRAFGRQIPTKVSPTYLQSLFAFSPKAAANLLPQLRRLGVIDADNATTPLARRLRDDDEYLEAAKEIVATVYPPELQERFPPPTDDVEGITKWLMLTTGGGQIGSSAQARFYQMLQSGQLPTAEKPANRKSPAAKSERKPAVQAKPDEPKTKVQDTPPPVDKTVDVHDGALPDIHLDIQIHIDAAATTDQIDAVFASMARHIYRK